MHFSGVLFEQDWLEEENETRRFSGNSFSQITVVTTMAIEILSLPLHSLYQECLEKNASQSHCSVSRSFLAITSTSFAASGQLQKI